MLRKLSQIGMIGALLAMIFSVSVPFVQAEEMQSGSYRIQRDTVGFGGENSSSSSYTIEDSAGEIATGDQNGPGRVLHAGFEQANDTTSTSTTPVTPPGNPGGGGHSSSVPNVVDFKATPETKDILLSWRYPAQSGIASVRIVRSTTFFPSGINDGDVIFDGAANFSGPGGLDGVVDHDVKPGVRYYYAIFARNGAGGYSSGALDSAMIAIPGKPGKPATPQEILAGQPNAIGALNPAIAALTLLDFEFIQSGKQLAHPKNSVVIDGTLDLTIRLAYAKVPETLKTIAISLSDPQDPSKAFTFLLRANADKTYYEATIGALGRSGTYALQAVILDYKNQGLKRLDGDLRALVVEKGSEIFGLNGADRSGMYLALALILILLAIIIFFLLSGRRRKARMACLVLLIGAGAAFGASMTARAAFNDQLNYQGKLANVVDIAVPDGSYNIRYKLYTVPSGGSPIWTETWCYSPDSGATCDGTGVDSRIPLRNGLFSTLLGSITPFTGVDFDQTLYLGVEIGAKGPVPGWDGEMTPRKKLGAVPAAFVARTANALSGLAAGQFLRSDTQNATSSSSTFLNVLQTGTGKIAEFFGSASQSVLSVLSNGNVGIGTTTPGSILSVGGVANFTTATSTFYSSGGLNLAAGCYAIAGSCISVNDLTGLINLASQVTGTLAVANGGTGASSFGQGWIFSNGGTGALSASTSPTVNYITATSTTATSTFNGGFTAGNNAALVVSKAAPANSLYIAPNGNVGVGTSSPGTALSIANVANFSAPVSTFYSPVSVPYITASSLTSTSTLPILSSGQSIFMYGINNTSGVTLPAVILDSTALLPRTHGMIILNGNVYATSDNNGGAGITVVNQIDKNIRDITSYTGGAPSQGCQITYASSTNKIYGVSQGPVWSFNVSTHAFATVLSSIPPNGFGACGSITNDGTYLYGVTYAAVGTLYKIRLSDNVLIATTTLPFGFAHAIVITPDHTKVVITSASGFLITAATSDLSLSSNVNLGASGVTRPTDDFTILNGYAYVGSEDVAGGIAKVDISTLAVSTSTARRSFGIFTDGTNLYNASPEGYIEYYKNADLSARYQFSVPFTANELLVSPHGQIYVTDWDSDKIYRIALPFDQVKIGSTQNGDNQNTDAFSSTTALSVSGEIYGGKFNGSFEGSFSGDGSQLTNLVLPTNIFVDGIFDQTDSHYAINVLGRQLISSDGVTPAIDWLTPGMIGINNVTTPTYTLDVNGNIGNSTGGNLVLQDLGGNVGIGTTTPGSLLTVGGNAYIDGALAVSGQSSADYFTANSLTTASAFPVLKFGGADLLNPGTSILYSQDGAFIVSDGENENVIIGDATGGNQSMGGFNNTGLGNEVLQHTTGGNNTAIGENALYQNTSGGENTAIGYFALQASTGINNTALGYHAGYLNTTGSNNIEIGNDGDPTDDNLIRIGSTQTKTLLVGNVGIGSTTPGTMLAIGSSTNSINLNVYATSTLSKGLNLNAGCYAISGSCLSLSGLAGLINLASQVTGTLAVANGGTGAATFGQGWIFSNGGTGALAASTSPTVNYITATSTTATSTLPQLSTTQLFVGNHILANQNNASSLISIGSAGFNGVGGNVGVGLSKLVDVSISTTTNGGLFGSTGYLSYGRTKDVSPFGNDDMLGWAFYGSDDDTGGLPAPFPILVASGYGNVSVPSGNFSVQGNSLFGVDPTIANALSDFGHVAVGTDLSIGTGAFANHTLDVNGTGFFSGNVGIGTSSPFAKLSVHANDGDTNTQLFTVASSTSVSTTTLFTVLNTGNVGIGTDAPLSALDVNGGVSIGTFAGTSAAPSNGLHVSGAVAIGTPTPTEMLTVKGTSNHSGSNIFSFLDSNGTVRSKLTDLGAQNWFLYDTASAGNVGSISYATPDTKPGIIFQNGPSFNLNRFNMINEGTYFNLGYDADGRGTAGLNVAAGGNVGIGITNPGAKLQIMGTSGLQLRLGTTGTSYWELGRDSTTGDFKLGDVTGGTMVTVNKTSGNFGIGTTSPYARLSVNGQIVGSYFTGTSTATSTFGGNLAINGTGTTTSAGGFDISAGCYAIGGNCIQNATGTASMPNQDANSYVLGDLSSLAWQDSGLGYQNGPAVISQSHYAYDPAVGDVSYLNYNGAATGTANYIYSVVTPAQVSSLTFSVPMKLPPGVGSADVGLMVTDNGSRVATLAHQALSSSWQNVSLTYNSPTANHEYILYLVLNEGDLSSTQAQVLAGKAQVTMGGTGSSMLSGSFNRVEFSPEMAWDNIIPRCYLAGATSPKVSNQCIQNAGNDVSITNSYARYVFDTTATRIGIESYNSKSNEPENVIGIKVNGVPYATTTAAWSNGGVGLSTLGITMVTLPPGLKRVELINSKMDNWGNSVKDTQYHTQSGGLWGSWVRSVYIPATDTAVVQMPQPSPRRWVVDADSIINGTLSGTPPFVSIAALLRDKGLGSFAFDAFGGKALWDDYATSTGSGFTYEINKMARIDPTDIMISLGTNDWTKQLWSAADIQKAYNVFLDEIHQRLPKAHVWIVSSGPRVGETTPNAFGDTIASIRAAQQAPALAHPSFTTFIDGTKLYTIGDTDGIHVFPAGQQRYATLLAAAIFNATTTVQESNNVTTDGNVGVGTTTPFATLSVTTALQQSGLLPLFLVASSTNTALFNVLGNGNVGIGTTTPGSLLSLGGIANFTTATTSFYGTGGLNIAAGCYAIGGNCLSLSGLPGTIDLTSQVTGTLAVANGGTGAASFGQGWIYSNGGTGALAASTSPTVNYVTATSTTATSTFSGSVLLANSAGTVGIATSSPLSAYKLSVGGSINLAQGAGLYSNNNQIVVADAIKSNFFGGDSAGTLTSGVNNMAIGSFALAINTTGSTNMALGVSSMRKNVSGSENVGVGANSLSSVNGGSDNVGVGYEAVDWHNGSGNGAVSRNVGIGSLVLYNLDTGGNDNTSVGFNSGAFITTGSKNTFIGSTAGKDDGPLSTLVTGTNMTGIGYGAQVTLSNSLVLGGTGANSVNVGIGTTSPLARLNVVGKLGDQTDLLDVASTTATDVVSSLFKIKANGNVGIATSSPYAKLSVAGQIVGAFFTGTTTATSTFGGNLAINGTGTSTSAGGFNLSAGCYAVSGVCLTTSSGSSFAYPFTLATNFGAANQATTGIAWFRNGLNASSTSHFANASTTLFTSTGSTYLATDGSNVGIGTAAPISTLSVNGRAAIGLYASTIAAPVNGLIVSGLTGIGNSSPLALLDVGTEVIFVHSDSGSEQDCVYSDLCLTRAASNPLYNSVTEGGYNSSVSPENTEWNVGDGWSDLSDIVTRSYGDMKTEVQNNLGSFQFIVGQELIMHVINENTYWKVKFTEWTQGVNGGGFAYTRELISTTGFALNVNGNGHIDDRLLIGSGATSQEPVTNLQVGAKVTDDNSRVYDANTLMVVQSTPTGTATLNDPQSVLYLARQGTAGQSFGAMATYKLSRFENAGGGNLGSRTRLDLNLTHDSFNDVNVMTWLSNGNIGIGTSTPGSLLSLGDTGANTINISATATSTFGSGLNIRTGCYAISNTCLSLSTLSGTLAVANGGTGATTFGQGWIFSNGGTGALSASTSPTVNYITATSTTATSTFKGGALFAIGGGNVGIATSSPYAKLSVAGQIVGAFFTGTTTATSTFGGNLAINGTGTTTSTGGFDISAGCYAISSNCLSLSSLGGTLAVANGGTGATTFGQGWIFSNGGTGALAASTSPTVNYLTATSTTATSTFNGSVLLANSAGTVGIATSSPLSAYKLSVGGSINLAQGAGLYSNNNLVVTADVTKGNFFGGDNAGTVTSGSNNMAIGSFAMAANTTGTTNMALGVSALRKNVGGSQNVAVGSASLSSMNGGTDNVGVGYEAIDWHNGSGNGAVSRNVGIGSLVLYNLDTGGNDNTSVGFNSGAFITTGSKNTFIGGIAGNGDGTVNTLVTGTNMTAIGYAAQVTLSNSLVLGAVGASSVNVGIGTTSPLARLNVVGKLGSQTDLLDIASTTATDIVSSMFKVRANGFVGIGSSTPWAQLSVNPTSANGSAPSFAIGSSTATKFVVTNGGSVGIGSSTPSSLLTVAGTSSLRTVLPEANLTYDLGSSGLRWNNAWIGTLNIGTSTWSMNNGSNGRFSLYNAASGGGSERLTVLSNGNVGIGTTTPQYKLDFAADQSLGSYTGNFSVNSGNVTMLGDGISPDTILTLKAYGADGFAGAVFNSGTGSTLTGYQGSTMTIDTGSESLNGQSAGIEFQTNGGVGINTADPQFTLDVNGDLNYSGSIFNVSDRRLKTDISSLNSASSLSNLLQLDPVTFKFKTDSATTSMRYGFIAQDVQKLYPDFVATDTKGFLHVDYQDFIPVIASAVQEQQGQINILASTTASLSSSVSSSATQTQQSLSQVSVSLQNTQSTVADLASKVSTLSSGSTSSSSDQISFMAEQASTTVQAIGALSSQVSLQSSRIDSLVETVNLLAGAANVSAPTTTDIATTLAPKVADSLASSTSFIQNISSSVASIIASSTDFMQSIASTVTSTIASSTTMVQTLASAVQSSLQTSTDWVFAKITSHVAYVDELHAGSLAVGTSQKPSGITLYDQTTGNPYCFKIENGSVNTIAGECSQSSSSSVANSAPTAPPSDSNPPSSSSAPAATTTIATTPAPADAASTTPPSNTASSGSGDTVTTTAPASPAADTTVTTTDAASVPAPAPTPTTASADSASASTGS